MTELIRYDAACRALAAAKSVDEAKDIADKAEAIRAYARQARNPQLEADAWEIRKRAEDRLGELSKALSKTAGRPPKNSSHKREELSKAEALKSAGISTSAASRYEKFNSLPADEKEARIAKGRAAIEAGKSAADSIVRGEDKADRRAEREREIGQKQLAMPTKRYGVLYADPPWRFEPYSRDTGMDRAPENHYATMGLAEIKALAVPAAEDAALFLWATAPMLPQALEVMAGWDFSYRTHFVWAKDKVGTGYWARSRHELLLLGIRGDIPAPAPGQQFDSVVYAGRGRHSAKPPAFREMIERMFPTLPRIELFARDRSAGWDAWGAEVDAAEQTTILAAEQEGKG